MAEEKPNHFTMDLKGKYTEAALFTALFKTAVSLSRSLSDLNLSPNHAKPFLCATSLASATSSYYYLINSHVYRHYSPSSQAVTLLSLLLILILHAALSLSSSPVKKVTILINSLLVLTLEFTVAVFYWTNKELFDDVASTVALLFFSLFLVCLLKLTAPGMGPAYIMMVIACGAAARVLPRFTIMVVLFVCYFVRFLLFAWGNFRISIRSEDKEALMARRALLLGLDDQV